MAGMRNTGRMTISDELAALFQRDLTRLVQQLETFPEEALWQRLGTLNTAGNLVLHLEGNLREFIGRQLGDVSFERDRPQEFAQTGLPVADLIHRIAELRQLIPSVLVSLASERLADEYPEQVFGSPISTQQFLIHLHGHFNYHLGQIDSIRRVLTDGAAVKYAGL